MVDVPYFMKSILLSSLGYVKLKPIIFLDYFKISILILSQIKTTHNTYIFVEYVFCLSKNKTPINITKLNFVLYSNYFFIMMLINFFFISHMLNFCHPDFFFSGSVPREASTSHMG